MSFSTNYSSRLFQFSQPYGQPMTEGDFHLDTLIYALKALQSYLNKYKEKVYVSSELSIYYEPDNPSLVVVPDLCVIFGVPQHQRSVYKVWEENDRTPNWILEVVSQNTLSQDLGAKKGIYAFLGVVEYFLYDLTGDSLQPQLQGKRLVAGNYLDIPSLTFPDGISLHSEVLGLDIRLDSGKLRFYDPIKCQNLLSYEECFQAKLDAEQAKNKAIEQAQVELRARKSVEARMAALENKLNLLKKQQQSLKHK